MKDDLGTRMKESYEFRARTFLPRRTYTIIRLDGKAFHTYTRGLDRPYDTGLMEDMAHTATFLCKQVGGTSFAYTQSDEISLLLTDFATPQTEAWFGGNVQKIVSVAASMCTDHFNNRRELRDFLGSKQKRAYFDARVFSIPDPTEVANYFVWRQKDATRNSISMAAQSQFNHKDLQGLGSSQLQEKLWQEANINWNDYPVAFKRGQLVAKIPEVMNHYINNGQRFDLPEPVTHYVWRSLETPIFTQSPWLQENIPVYT